LYEKPTTSVRDSAWNLLQEALDSYATVSRHAIGTRLGNEQYITWEKAGDSYAVTIAETCRMPFAIAACASSNGAPREAAAIPPHHPSFRFYRRAILSNDLHDAFRNAYLALECVVSDESPKRENESEVTWLKRVLNDSLLAGLPGGIDIDAFVNRIYQQSRLPLFHAKTGRSFYLPNGPERDEIIQAFELLNLVLAGIYRYKCHIGAGGWSRLSQSTKDEMVRAGLAFDEVRFKSEGECHIVSAHVDLADTPRRAKNIWGRLSLPLPAALSHFDVLELYFGGELRATLDLPEPVSLICVNSLVIEIAVLISSTRAPNPSHAM
jgi:hypothetical protein